MSAVDVYFRVKGRDLLYCDVYAYPKGRPYSDFNDDIGWKYCLNGKKKSEELIVKSDLRGGSWDTFAILPKENTLQESGTKQNLGGKKRLLVLT